MQNLREWLSRLWGTLRGGRSDADLQRELQSHLEMADNRRTVEATPGIQVTRAMDALRDQRGLPRLDALASDVVFGCRQLRKHRAATAAAILSLGLAIGATLAAFQLIDAVLLRALPVADPGNLFAVVTTFLDADKRPNYRDDFDYPTYREYVRAVGDRADLLVIGFAVRMPFTFANNTEPEPTVGQFVSGNAFGALGLQPAQGRLLTPADDVTPGAHPVAVISYALWTRRFNRDPGAVGASIRFGSQRYEIVGVAPEEFTGTEPGSLTDIYLPAMMNAQAITSPGWSWFRLWLRPRPGVAPAQIEQMLPDPGNELELIPAGAGVSAIQKVFRRPLLILAALAGAVLLIACANVANLLTAQAVARTREMALRVSIGAGRARLIQMVLVESALLALASCAAAALFSTWAAPFVVSMLAPPERPVQLLLEPDLRALTFGVLLTLAVTALFGVWPALRASSVKPLGALRGRDPGRGHQRVAQGLLGAQMAFCVFLLFSAGLFLTTFDRLVNQPLGFAHRDVLVVKTETRTPHPPEVWARIADHVRQVPGVASVAVAGWAPLTGNNWRASVRVVARPVPATSPFVVAISAGYFETMRIGVVAGRDFRPGDVAPLVENGRPRSGVGIVNEALARAYFDGGSPVGRRVEFRDGGYAPMEIVGVVGDAAYSSVRDAKRPTVYVPRDPADGGSLLVRAAAEPSALAAVLRREVPRAHPELHVRAIDPLTSFVTQQMIRERLLAALSGFFAFVALVLASIGLYGVLNSAVVRQRREIGIRMALGARASHVVRGVTSHLFAIAALGALAGLGGGIAFGRVVRTLLFQVTPTDLSAAIMPGLTLAVAALVAALPPAIRAVRTDPAQALRAE